MERRSAPNSILGSSEVLTSARSTARALSVSLRATPFNEADTRAKLIDPALRRCGWTEDLVFREQTAGSIVLDGRRARQLAGRADYLLRVRVNPGTQPVPLALIEAKAESRPPGHGLEQARTYARRFNAPFVFSSNGHQFVFHDSTTGLTSDPALLADFPGPDKLRLKWQAATNVDLDSPAARALLTPYRGGEGTRRYYQDAAIRAVFEKFARGDKRALLSLATGAGKTFIAAHMLRRLFDARMARRALRHGGRRGRAVPHQRERFRPDQAQAARFLRIVVHRLAAGRRLHQRGRRRQD
jgi:type I restriction enzyme R subunit